jgi:hypothetical protein
VKRPSLFDDRRGDGNGALTPVGVAGNPSRLTKAQKQFNSLISRIAEQRRELAQWQAFVPVYRQVVAGSIEPLNARLRERRIALVMLLDRAVAGDELTRREQAKAREILLGQLSRLLAEAPDAELVQIHDAYSDVSFQDAQAQDMALMRAVAVDAFDVEFGDEDEANNLEELAELIGDRLRTAQAGQAGQEDEQWQQWQQWQQRPKEERRKGAKSLAREALREKAAQGATRALREVYRKLASELHPDRELDPGERSRKTALMQQANQAYAARDLVGLLELQLRIAQIDPAALTNLAQEQLAYFNQVLREQSQRLQEELSDLTMPFVTAMGGAVPRRFTPDVVQRALDTEMRELRMALKDLEADLADFQDIRRLKAALQSYRAARPDADELAMLQSLLAAGGRTRRR